MPFQKVLYSRPIKIEEINEDVIGNNNKKRVQIMSPFFVFIQEFFYSVFSAEEASPSFKIFSSPFFSISRL